MAEERTIDRHMGGHGIRSLIPTFESTCYEYSKKEIGAINVFLTARECSVDEAIRLMRVVHPEPLGVVHRVKAEVARRSVT